MKEHIEQLIVIKTKVVLKKNKYQDLICDAVSDNNQSLVEELHYEVKKYSDIECYITTIIKEINQLH